MHAGVRAIGLPSFSGVTFVRFVLAWPPPLTSGAPGRIITLVLETPSQGGARPDSAGFLCPGSGGVCPGLRPKDRQARPCACFEPRAPALTAGMASKAERKDTTIKSDISRRRALATIGAGAAATAAGTTALADTNPLVTKTDPLVALEHELIEADKAEGRAAAALDDAESETWLGKGYPIVAAVEAGKYYCVTEPELRERCREQGMEADEERLVGTFRERQAAYRKGRVEAGLKPLDDALAAASAHYSRHREMIATTPAQTVEGVAVKVRLLADSAENGSTGVEGEATRTALEALERLARRTAS